MDEWWKSQTSEDFTWGCALGLWGVKRNWCVILVRWIFGVSGWMLFGWCLKIDWMFFWKICERRNVVEEVVDVWCLCLEMLLWWWRVVNVRGRFSMFWMGAFVLFCFFVSSEISGFEMSVVSYMSNLKFKIYYSTYWFSIRILIRKIYKKFYKLLWINIHLWKIIKKKQFNSSKDKHNISSY